MSKLLKVLSCILLIVWIPLFVSAVMGWFTAVAVGCKLTYTMLVLAALVPPIVTWSYATK